MQESSTKPSEKRVAAQTNADSQSQRQPGGKATVPPVAVANPIAGKQDAHAAQQPAESRSPESRWTPEWWLVYVTAVLVIVTTGLAISGANGTMFPVPVDTAMTILQGQTRCYMWGRIEYRDVFPNTPMRVTRFAAELLFRGNPYNANDEPGFRMLDRHNDAT